MTNAKHTPTKAKQFCEAMSAVSNSYKERCKVDAVWKSQYKSVRFMKHEGKRGLRFDDGSKLFFGEEGKFILPADEA